MNENVSLGRIAGIQVDSTSMRGSGWPAPLWGWSGLRWITAGSRIPGNGRFREVTEGHEGHAIWVQAAA